MTRLAVVLAALLIFSAGVLLFRPMILALVRTEEREPAPENWWPVIARAVPLVSRLGPDERDRLLSLTRELITTCHWEGCGGLSLTTGMQAVIAAQASLLELGRPGVLFPNLKEILVYPTTFVPGKNADLRKWRAERERGPELGEAWSTGTIVLAWDDSVLGSSDPVDGHNVVLHEFAHLLDYEGRLTTRFSLMPRNPMTGDAADPIPEVGNPEQWKRLITESYERFCALSEQAETPPVFDRYAMTNEAEFFAVATEAFFEKPGEFGATFPELFEAFRGYYRQDPRRLHGFGSGNSGEG